MTLIIGVDPGARDTGIVAVRDGKLLCGLSVHNDSPALLPMDRTYLRDVVNSVSSLLLFHLKSPNWDDFIIRVETVVRPNWHVAKAAGGGSASNPEALLATALVQGALMAQFECEIVRPRKHGSKPMGSYPPELVSDGERRKDGWENRVGTGKLRHQRSAWDVALTEPKVAK